MSDSPGFIARWDDWVEWIDARPDYWRLFVQLSDELLAAGATKSSHWLVVNQMRWLHALRRIDGDYLIPNGMIAFAARDYMSDDPAVRGGLFDIRAMPGEDFEKTKRECGITG